MLASAALYGPGAQTSKRHSASWGVDNVAHGHLPCTTALIRGWTIEALSLGCTAGVGSSGPRQTRASLANHFVANLVSPPLLLCAFAVFELNGGTKAPGSGASIPAL